MLENLKNTEKDVTDIINKLDILEGKRTETNKVWDIDTNTFLLLKSVILEIDKIKKTQQRYEYYQKMMEELLYTQDVSLQD